MYKQGIRLLSYVVITFSVGLMGCANQGRQTERAVGEILNRNGNCFSSSCMLNVMRQLNAVIPNSDPQKGPAIMAFQKLYGLALKVERGQISNRGEIESQRMGILAELQMNMQRANAISSMQRAAEMQQQRQMLQEAQSLLSPTNNSTLTCRPAMGAPPGTTVCQ